jgi:hypothetical protein
VGLVQDDTRVLAHVRIDQRLSKQQTVRHVLDLRVRPGAVLESDRVPDLLSETATDLFGDSFGDRCGSDSTRLGTPDLTSVGETFLGEILGELGCLSRAGLSDDDEDGILHDTSGSSQRNDLCKRKKKEDGQTSRTA